MKLQPVGPAIVETNEVWRIVDLFLLRNHFAVILLSSVTTADHVLARGVDPIKGTTLWETPVTIPPTGLRAGCLFKIDEHTVGLYEKGASSLIYLSAITDTGSVRVNGVSFPYAIERIKEECYSTFDVTTKTLYGVAWQSFSLPRVAFGFALNFITLGLDDVWPITLGQNDNFNYYEVVPASFSIYGGALAVRPNPVSHDLTSWSLVDGYGTVLDTSAKYAGVSADAIIQATPDPKVIAVIFMDDTHSATKKSQVWAQFYQLYPTFRKLELSRAGFVMNSTLTEVGVAADDPDYLNGLPYNQPRVLSRKYRFYDTVNLQHSSGATYPGAVCAVASLRRLKDRGEIYTIPMPHRSTITTQQLLASPLPPSFEPVQFAVATRIHGDLVLFGGTVGTSAAAPTSSPHGPSAFDAGVIPSGPGDISGMTANQVAHARSVIATGKALGFSGPDITIAIMVAITESGLQNYANANIPESLVIPHDAVGSDHASVGVFQQQVGIWGTAPELMDVPHSATLFFNRLGGAPRAGLAPWQIAQEIQISAFADGSNYRANYNRAVAISQALFDATLAAPPTSPNPNIFSGSDIPWQSTLATVFLSGYGSFVADMGPYLGSFPLLAPGVVDAGGSTFFCVGLPGTTVGGFADDSYETDVFTSGRTDYPGHVPPTYTTYNSAHHGAIRSPVLAEAIPTGAHLYVLVTPAAGATAPAHGPSYYVPSTLSALGNATHMTANDGHWSATQDWTYSLTANLIDSGQWGTHNTVSQQVSGSTSDTPITPGNIASGDHDLSAFAAVVQSNIVAGISPGGTDPLGITAYKEWRNNNSVFFTPWLAASLVGINEVQRYQLLDGSNVLDPYPSVPLPPENGGEVDPITGSAYRFIGSAGPITWSMKPTDYGVGTNISCQSFGEYNGPQPSVLPLPPGSVSATYRVANADAMTPASIAAAQPISDSMTTGFLSVPVTWPAIPASFGVDASWSYTSSEVSAPPADGSHRVLLVYQASARVVSSTPAPVTDFPMPVYDAGNGSRIGYSAYVAMSAGMTASSRRPYQYWVPGAVVPAPPGVPSGGGGALPATMNTNVYQLVKVGLDNLVAQDGKSKAVNFW